MNYLLPLFIIFSFVAHAKVNSELSGNLEVQGRHAWNNPEAKDLFQNWDQEDFYLMYGNLNGKLEFDHSRLEANWFVRKSFSKLYKNDYAATRIYNFPNSLVARNIFKLEYKDQDSNGLTESVLNKIYYEFDYKEHRFAFGRMYINYGLGEIFNPINPFNQPTGLTSIQQVAQGNDGFSFTYFMSENHTIGFYALGDKYVENYQNEFTKTFWVHGEYQFSDKLQLDYVLGEDQKRGKVGGQVSYQGDEALYFGQVLYQTSYVDNKDSSNLWDALLGYDRQLDAKWHLRFEGGYQKQNKFAQVGFGSRFLPTEYFAALALVDEIHPLVKLTGTVVNDIKSGFTYLIAKSTFNLSHNMEADIFGYTPIAKGDTVDNPAQKLVTTDLGVALRAFF
mgnify:CR=1 FL=1